MYICHKRWKTRYMSQEKPVNLYFNQTSQFQKKKKFLNIKYVKPKRKNLSLIKLHISLRYQASYVTCLCVINLLNNKNKASPTWTHWENIFSIGFSICQNIPYIQLKRT